MIMKSAVRCILLGLSMMSVPACAMQKPVQPIPYNVALGSGPFKVVPTMQPALPAHTIYAPSPQALGGQKLPIVVWGVGGCLDKGTWFRFFLSEIASHGYVVISNGRMGPLEDQIWQPEPNPNRGPPDPAKLPPAATTPHQLIEEIDWAIAENSRPQSPYHGRIDTAKIAFLGMSCGGVQAIEAGADPRVSTTVVWNTGLFPDASGLNATAGGKALTKADLVLLHGSVAYISGDQKDVAFPNANEDFEHLPDIPALRAYRKDTPHEGTYWEPNGGEFGQVAVNWLDWQLKGNPDARKMFAGADCGLCRNPQWVVKQKNLP